MNAAFYIASAVTLLSTIMVVTRLHAIHALLYLIVSFLAVAVVFYTLGAPFIAALEVIIYAGAIMVLFVFVVMMLPARAETMKEEQRWFAAATWIGPSTLAAVLGVELAYLLLRGALSSGPERPAIAVVSPRTVSIALFGPYLLSVELASFLLLAAIVGTVHLGSRRPRVGEVSSP